MKFNDHKTFSIAEATDNNYKTFATTKATDNDYKTFATTKATDNEVDKVELGLSRKNLRRTTK